MANLKEYYTPNQKKNDDYYYYYCGDWKKSKDHHNLPNPAGSHITTTNNLSSPHGRQLSARELEERFCATVGGISLEDVVQMQKYMYQYEKILQWKDSAVEEAFWNTKNRFWAEIHNQPCDIKLPDQDLFIDKIDWDSTIDPKLLSDLENWEMDGSSETEHCNGGVIVGIPSITTQCDLTPSGWGDAEEVKPQPEFSCRPDQVGIYHWVDNGVKKNDLTPTGWGDAEDVGNSQWVDNGVKREQPALYNRWEDDCIDVTQSIAWNRGNRVSGPTLNSYRKQRDNGYNRKGDRGGWSTSRYKISRFENNNYARPFDNYEGRKGNFSRERPISTWKPVTRHW